MRSHFAREELYILDFEAMVFGSYTCKRRSCANKHWTKYLLVHHLDSLIPIFW